MILNNFKRISLKKKGSYYGRKEIKKILTYKKINNINLIKKVISIWGGIVLIKESGGYINNIDGTDFNEKKNDIIASNTKIHKELVNLL